MSIMTKIGIFGVIFALLALGLWFIAHESYNSGYAAAQLADNKALQDEQAKSNALANQLFAKNTLQVAPIEQKAQSDLAAIQSAAPPQVQTIIKVVHDQPTYATCSRPADVERVRASDLSAIAALVGESPVTTASSAPAVPTAGH